MHGLYNLSCDLSESEGSQPSAWEPPLAYNMYHSLLEVFAVIGPIHLVCPRLIEVVVVVWGHDA